MCVTVSEVNYQPTIQQAQAQEDHVRYKGSM